MYYVFFDTCSTLFLLIQRFRYYTLLHITKSFNISNAADAVATACRPYAARRVLS